MKKVKLSCIQCALRCAVATPELSLTLHLGNRACELKFVLQTSVQLRLKVHFLPKCAIFELPFPQC